MTVAPFYHVGFLVGDITSAAERFGDLLHVRFGPTATFSLDESRFVGERPSQSELRYAYSVEGPPYIELIEAQDDGVWGRQHGEGLHHIGVFENELDDRLAELAALRSDSLTARAWLVAAGELVAAYFEETTVLGTRLELVKAPSEK